MARAKGTVDVVINYSEILSLTAQLGILELGHWHLTV